MQQPTLFLPGLMCDQRLWQPTWQHLSADIESTNLQFALKPSIEEMAKDVDSHMPSHPVNLVGFSMGGYIALHYALHYALNKTTNNAQQVKSLTIIAASSAGLTQTEKKQRAQTLNHVKNSHYNGIAKQRIAQFVHPDHINDPVVDIIRQMDKSLGKETLIAQLQANTYRPSLTERLNELNIPVLIVGAAEDQLVSQQAIHAMHRGIKQSQLTIIEHCGHMIPLEAPQTLARTINEFLTTIY
ncbi:MAG: pimeloyl-ACP methyl ester carboxylesterase [Alteromonadaceae bacterium]|jgi:pimeloyl-ACP methyl ester carboxylesterase